MQSAYREKKDLYAVIGAACFHNDYYSNLEFKPTLISDGEHLITMEVNSDVIELLEDDEILVNNRYTEALKIKAGDTITLSDGTITVKEVSHDGVYIRIIYKK